MLDIALIREKPDWVKEQLAKLFDDEAPARIDKTRELDELRREIRTRIETAQGARNRLNRAMGKLRGNRQMDDSVKAGLALAATAALKRHDTDAALAFLQGESAPDAVDEGGFQSAFDGLIAALRALGQGIDDGFAEAKAIETELEELMLWIPNLPHCSVPVFESEEENVAGVPVGEFREFDFDPKPHWELGPELGIIDFERGVKLAGTRAYVCGDGARVCSGP